MSTRRIVSLVPSLTDTVCALGLRDELVGCTSFCVEPPGLQRTAALVGGTKNPELERIAALKPTHVLVNEEENKPEHIAALQDMAAEGTSTLVTFTKDPREVPALLREMAAWLGGGAVQAAGERWARTVEARLEELAAARAAAERAGTWRTRRYLYYIWREPYMVVARDTYISAMLALAGLENAVPDGAASRYPTLTVDEARALAPDLLLLSSEPYPFRNRDAERLRGEWPGAPEIAKIDGQLASWYGTMLVEALPAMARWVRGEAAELRR